MPNDIEEEKRRKEEKASKFLGLLWIALLWLVATEYRVQPYEAEGTSHIIPTSDWPKLEELPRYLVPTRFLV